GPSPPLTLRLAAAPHPGRARNKKKLPPPAPRAAARGGGPPHLPPQTHVAADPSTPPFTTLDVLNLQLPGPKRAFDPNRNITRLREQGIKYVIVTGSVTDRVLAARSSYPRESAFYDALRRRTRLVYHVDPGGDRAGPWVSIYRL